MDNDNSDDPNLDALLAQRYSPAAPKGLKAALKTIPERVPAKISLWQDVLNIYREIFAAPLPAMAVAASLVLGVWCGLEAEMLLEIADQDVTSVFIDIENISEEWL